jgi:hypothetical protein
MGFDIADGITNTQQAWFPIDMTLATQTLYVGQLVKKGTGAMNGVGPLAAASGAYDITGDQQILGIVMGTNNYPLTELFDATYGQYITAVATQAAQKAIMKMGVEGMHPKNDPAPYVQLALLEPSIWCKAPIFNGTFGTATTVLTVTTGSTTGASMTTNAHERASVANLSTMYCRTGANAGIYRVDKSASTTTHTFDTYFPFAISVGDTFVMANMVQGESYVQINTTTGYLGMCFDNGADASSSYFGITVKELNLAEAGKEYIVFKFSAAHFAGIRT